MKVKYVLLGILLSLITVASCQAASEETASGNDSWALLFSGQKITDNTWNNVISPDSTRVAYLNQSKKGVSLIVAGPEGKNEGKSYDFIRDIVFSPDSTRVAYFARTDGKWIAVVDDSEGKQYDGMLTTVIFSPDSKRVAYLALNGNQTAVVADGEENLYHAAGVPIFSPDSKHLAYAIDEEGGFDSSYIILDGQELKPEGKSFVFSPDSNRWAYSSHNLYAGSPVYTVLNNKTLELGNNGAIYGLYFSPDSQRFAFDMLNGSSFYSLHRIVVDEVYGKEYREVGKVVFSPDSRHVAYWARSREDGYFVVLDGIEGQKNYSDVREPIFSQDSTHTAYAALKDDGWHVVLDGNEGSNYSAVRSLTFSPDSKHLAYTARATRDGKDMQFVVVDGKEMEQYLHDRHHQGILYGPVFSPDGKLVYAANDGGKAQFIVVDGTRKLNPWSRFSGSTLVFDSPDSFHYLGTNETGSFLVKVNIVEKPEEEACSWSGIWETDHGFMDLEQTGNSVTGIYTGNLPYQDQGIQAIASDKKLVGNWSYSSGKAEGTFEFSMADDCKSFSGKWKHDSEVDWSGNWNGTRV